MGSGNPMLDLGKNKAKIVAEPPEEQVKFSDKDLLPEKKDLLEKMAHALLEKEALGSREIN